VAVLAMSPGRGGPPAAGPEPGILERAAAILEWLPLDRVRALATRVSLGGLRRLSDEDLVERMRIEREILRAADDATCAAMARGEATPAAILSAVRGLRPGDAARWCILAERAVTAEVAGFPEPVEVPPRAFDRAWTALLGSFPPGEGERLERAMAGLAKAGNAEAARTVRELYDAALALREPHRSVLARAMVGK